MSAPFVSGLRVGDDVIVLGGGDGNILHLRAQAAELWETVRVNARESVSVAAVKAAALESFYGIGASVPDYVVKVRGFEILDEGATLASSGIRDGSTLLIARRRRRPVR